MMLLIINIDSDISEGIACRRMSSFSPKTLSALAVFRAGRLINQTRHLIGMETSEVNAFPPYESPNIPCATPSQNQRTSTIMGCVLIADSFIS
ncbi:MULTISPECIES: hypothetical protein [Serratia]|uniref:hypothetical protein n=1 Tax=Serratia TaxID=613 RepID=UPI0004E2B738|nr:hypothetical protein [Serratia marcescens]KFB55743.1 hypothetical protein DH21_14585 [Serratia marcescens]MBN5334843.1 hypothetical protein [Serratia marcescens]MBN5340670.1 hypothetical protein [Serratia marcescens]MCW7558157.1 hypothetical protein [Serratia marcescens]MCW7563061.1 hypothetical protein [Serratia marcescens]